MQRAGANTTTIGMHKGSASLVTACIGCRIQIHNCCRGLSSRASTGIEGHETGRAATGGLVEEGGHPAKEIHTIHRRKVRKQHCSLERKAIWTIFIKSCKARKKSQAVSTIMGPAVSPRFS